MTWLECEHICIFLLSFSLYLFIELLFYSLMSRPFYYIQSLVPALFISPSPWNFRSHGTSAPVVINNSRSVFHSTAAVVAFAKGRSGSLASFFFKFPIKKNSAKQKTKVHHSERPLGCFLYCFSLVEHGILYRLSRLMSYWVHFYLFGAPVNSW